MSEKEAQLEASELDVSARDSSAVEKVTTLQARLKELQDQLEEKENLLQAKDREAKELKSEAEDKVAVSQPELKEKEELLRKAGPFTPFHPGFHSQRD